MHLIIIFIAIAITMGFYVHGDAEKRGMNTILWTTISVLFMPFGIIIYLMVRKDINEKS